MKNSLSILRICLFCSISLVVVASGFAEISPDNNEFGIYTDPSGGIGSASIIVPPVTPFGAYLVLTNPVNDTFDGGTNTNTPVNWVEAFECRINKPAGLGSTWFQLSEVLPPETINVGTAPDYVTGSASPYPVANNAVVLISWEIMVLTGDVFEWYLDITTPQSIPGTMAYQDAEDSNWNGGNIPLVSAYPSSGSSLLPVFSVNGGVMAVENESWGGVKALFR